MKYETEIRQAAERLWNYHRLGHSLTRADFIVAMGCKSLAVPERALELYKQSLAPIIICAGGGLESEKPWTITEAERFAQHLKGLGIPKADILTEDESTDTGKNVTFTRDGLDRFGYSPQRVIFVHLPYMERRTFATVRKQWPELPERGVMVTSSQVSFSDYPLPLLRLSRLITDQTLKMRRYAELGYQIEQDVPTDVQVVANELDDMLRLNI